MYVDGETMQAKPNMMDDIYAFSNCGFFIFPLLVTDPRKMNAFLSSRPEWESNDKSFYPQYLLHYASRMTGIANDRLRCFRYKAPLSLPLYFFDAQIRERLLRRGETYCGGSPDLQAISLYWFGTGIAFLEFSVLYGDMPASEITEFTYLFRSLRFNETRLNGFPEDKIALETAIKQILPEEQSSSVICFNNPALFKKQANIFTLLNSKSCAIEPEKIERCRYLLSHGFNSEFAEKTADETPYEMCQRFGQDTIWGGSQEGLVCIVEKTHAYQFSRLCNDYHFLYLLLLNQRFAAIAAIEAFSWQDIDLRRSRDLHSGIVSLKTRFSFRVISDDRQIQTIYSEMYHVFELENLLQDLEDANDQMSVLLQMRQQKHERRFEMILGALSILAIFSALIDFSDYLDRFSSAMTLHSVISLSTTAVILITCVIFIFRREK